MTCNDVIWPKNVLYKSNWTFEVYDDLWNVLCFILKFTDPAKLWLRSVFTISPKNNTDKLKIPSFEVIVTKNKRHLTLLFFR